MPNWISTLIEIILGPIILLIVLPVIPTIWILFVYPIFSYRLNHTKFHFSFGIKFLIFYFISVLFCLPILSIIKNTIEHPNILFPLFKSTGFQILIAYSLITSLFHKQLIKFSNSSFLLPIKKWTLNTLYAIALKLKFVKTNNQS